MNVDFLSTFTKKLIDDILTEAREHYEKKEDNEIWISELVACKHKALFNKLYREQLFVEPRLVVGTVIHKGFQEWLREKHGAETEIEFEKEINGYTIKGRVDAVAEQNIIEIKYASDIKGNEPYEHHVLQLRLYLWLAEYEEGRLIYITPNRLIEFKITEKMTDDDVLMLIDTWQSPEWDWECDYCRFYSICNLGKRRR
jgi:CRISPR-associated exonuclease Cas4